MKEIINNISITLILLSLVSCSMQEDSRTIKKLESRIKSLISENELLKNRLAHYDNERMEKQQLEYHKKEQLRKSSQGLVLDDRVQLLTVKTGYVASSIMVPSISFMFKNIDHEDIKDYIKVSGVFIDNDSGEQIDEDFSFLCTNSKPFSAGTKKQITVQSSVGWDFILNQNVSVKISIDDQLFKTYKIKKEQYGGRL